MPIASPMVSDAFSSCSCSPVNHLYTHFIAFTRSQSRHASSDVPDHPFIQEMMLARVSVCSTSDHDRYELVVVRNYRLNLKYCVEDRHRNTCIVHLSTTTWKVYLLTLLTTLDLPPASLSRIYSSIYHEQLEQRFCSSLYSLACHDSQLNTFRWSITTSCAISSSTLRLRLGQSI